MLPKYKGTVDPKIKILSFSTCPHTDEKTFLELLHSPEMPGAPNHHCGGWAITLCISIKLYEQYGAISFIFWSFSIPFKTSSHHLV